MDNNMTFLDFITVLSFGIGLYALDLAIANLDMNDKQNEELKEILHYLDKHLKDQDNHLASQDRILENLTKGG